VVEVVHLPLLHFLPWQPCPFLEPLLVFEMLWDGVIPPEGEIWAVAKPAVAAKNNTAVHAIKVFFIVFLHEFK
jgi:hypothetical protein